MAENEKRDDVDEMSKDKKLDRKKKLRNKKKKKKINKKQDVLLGVMYLTQIPHGFYEEEIKSYFAQFGKVRRIRLARSRKTGNSKGYAYIEFFDDEVAKIAADAMNNYLMFDKLMKSKFIPKEKVHVDTFKNAFRENKQIRSTRVYSITTHNSDQSSASLERTVKIYRKRINDKKKKLSELGIKFEFDIDVPESIDLKSEESDVKAKTLEAKSREEILSDTITNDRGESKLTKKSVSRKKMVAKSSKDVTKKQSNLAKKRKASSDETKSNGNKKDRSYSKSVFVLEMDSSDEEISFKTPPNALKTSRKSLGGYSASKSNETNGASVKSAKKVAIKTGKEDISGNSKDKVVKSLKKTPKNKVAAKKYSASAAKMRSSKKFKVTRTSM